MSECNCGKNGQNTPNVHYLETCWKAWREQILSAWDRLPDHHLYVLVSCGYKELADLANAEVVRRGLKNPEHPVNFMHPVFAAKQDQEARDRKVFNGGYEVGYKAAVAKLEDFRKHCMYFMPAERQETREAFFKNGKV